MDKTLQPHPLGIRQTVQHMCPECSRQRPFCTVCLGVGHVSSDVLSAWQREQYRKAERGEL